MFTRRNAFAGALAMAAASTTVQAAKPKLSKKQLGDLIEKAKTPADHQRLADYYAGLAAEFEAESKDHTAMAAMYEKNPTVQQTKAPGGVNTVSHCRFIATKYSEMAEAAKSMAAIHVDMAKKAR